MQNTRKKKVKDARKNNKMISSVILNKQKPYRPNKQSKMIRSSFLEDKKKQTESGIQSISNASFQSGQIPRRATRMMYNSMNYPINMNQSAPFFKLIKNKQRLRPLEETEMYKFIPQIDEIYQTADTRNVRTQRNTKDYSERNIKTSFNNSRVDKYQSNIVRKSCKPRESDLIGKVLNPKVSTRGISRKVKNHNKPVVRNELGPIRNTAKSVRKHSIAAKMKMSMTSHREMGRHSVLNGPTRDIFNTNLKLPGFYNQKSSKNRGVSRKRQQTSQVNQDNTVDFGEYNKLKKNSELNIIQSKRKKFSDDFKKEKSRHKSIDYRKKSVNQRKSLVMSRSNKQQITEETRKMNQSGQSQRKVAENIFNSVGPFQSSGLQIQGKLSSQPYYPKIELKFAIVNGKENGKEKIGQDSVLVYKFKSRNIQFHVFGVFDGHGTHGHHVSLHLKKSVIPVLKRIISNQNSDNFDFKEVLSVLTKELHSQIATINRRFKDSLNLKPGSTRYTNLSSSYAQVKENKGAHNFYDASLSGSTCSLVIIFKNKIYSLTLGDSKSVLGLCNSSDPQVTNAYQISTEHKTTNKMEEERIIREGGIVQPVLDLKNNPVGPPRIWDSSLKYPGLMVTRSFGDLLGKHCGVSEIPGIGLVN